MKVQDAKELFLVIISVLATITLFIQVIRTGDAPGQILLNPGLCAWAVIAVLTGIVGVAKEN